MIRLLFQLQFISYIRIHKTSVDIIKRLKFKMALQGSQKYLHDMLDMSEDPQESARCPSEIAQFFAGRNVLITGGSGFIGKLLVEKLLRCCPDIKVLYLLMRAKKGKTAKERFEEYFKDIVFSKLRKAQPNYYNKVVMIEGDTSQVDLGLSSESRRLLLDTHIIFHGAATVRFDEQIRKATNINIRGTKQLLLFAKEMPNFLAFVHISTAFTHCIEKSIEEVHYEPPMKTKDILALTEILDDKTLELCTPSLLGDFPNTYAYSKAIGEEAVKEYSIGIPACIIRPSIVISTFKEPLYAWTNNLYGSTGIVVAAGIGLLHTLRCDRTFLAEIIPADFVISNIVACAWDTAVNRQIPKSIKDVTGEPTMTDIERVPIYNCVSTCQNPITWGDYVDKNIQYCADVPSSLQIWHCFITFNNNDFIQAIYTIFLHFLPAAIIDTYLYLSGRKPMLWNIYKKMQKFSNVITYFSCQQWVFRNDAVVKLWNKMNPTDQDIFYFNLETLDWDNFFYFHVRGLRFYLAKDPFDTVEQGRVRSRRLKYAHYTFITTVCLTRKNVTPGIIFETNFGNLSRTGQYSCQYANQMPVESQYLYLSPPIIN
ncbi:hypothetical protein KM043_013019 [Ampulex compressa]|nr:hypothetical protein KM043_013019 [Ampulex compressa]